MAVQGEAVSNIGIVIKRQGSYCTGESESAKEAVSNIGSVVRVGENIWRQRISQRISQ